MTCGALYRIDGAAALHHAGVGFAGRLGDILDGLILEVGSNSIEIVIGDFEVESMIASAIGPDAAVNLLWPLLR
jgi:hypothetical protein